MMIAWLRNPPSTVDTPYGRHPITRMYGLSHRGWFFGLQTVGKLLPPQSPAKARAASDAAKREREARDLAAAFWRDDKVVRVVDHEGEPTFVPLNGDGVPEVTIEKPGIR